MNVFQRVNLHEYKQLVSYHETILEKSLRSNERLPARFDDPIEIRAKAAGKWEFASKLKGKNLPTLEVIEKLTDQLNKDEITQEQFCRRYPDYLSILVFSLKDEKEVKAKNPNVTQLSLYAGRIQQEMTKMDELFKTTCRSSFTVPSTPSNQKAMEDWNISSLPLELIDMVVQPQVKVPTNEVQRQLNEMFSVIDGLRGSFCGMRDLYRGISRISAEEIETATAPLCQKPLEREKT